LRPLNDHQEEGVVEVSVDDSSEIEIAATAQADEEASA